MCVHVARMHACNVQNYIVSTSLATADDGTKHGDSSYWIMGTVCDSVRFNAGKCIG